MPATSTSNVQLQPYDSDDTENDQSDNDEPKAKRSKGRKYVYVVKHNNLQEAKADLIDSKNWTYIRKADRPTGDKFYYRCPGAQCQMKALIATRYRMRLISTRLKESIYTLDLLEIPNYPITLWKTTPKLTNGYKQKSPSK